MSGAGTGSADIRVCKNIVQYKARLYTHLKHVAYKTVLAQSSKAQC